ncbi:MAG TPA: DUF4412 domain-containing protein [Chthoniobacterales bacterium]|nr:DUF4412 domain-containing protein [Chthoniobacterales bacterium]
MPARDEAAAPAPACQVISENVGGLCAAIVAAQRRLPLSPNLPIAPTPASNCHMKSLHLFGIASLALLATSRADLTIVQKVDGAGGGVHELTLKVKGDKARVDINPQITTIIDAKTGEVTTLLNDKKTVMRISGEKAKAMAEMAKSFAKEESPTQALPKSTGKKETINGYETEEYVTDSPKYHASYWVAKSYPNYQSILQQMSIMQQGAFAGLTKGLPDYHALPGLPLRTQVRIPGQDDVTSTIESLKLDPLPDSDFSIPAGYSEIKMPDFIGGKQPPGKPDDPGNE